MRSIMIVAMALGLAATPALAQQQQQQQDQAQQGQQKQQAAQLSADAHHLIGKKAATEQGKDLGKIKDVLVGQDGKVQALVMDYKGKSHAVPWDQVQLKADQVMVNMSEQALSQTPEYKGEKD